MPQIEVTLPSGARGIVRGLKGRELNLFANKQAARRGKTSQQILDNVWIETLDPGPLYSDGVKWSEALQCDRFVALFYARIATFGGEFEFRHKCGDSDCGKSFTWVENLDLRPIKPLPPESIEQFLAGNRFKTEVCDEHGDTRAVVFQLLTPKLEDKISQAQNLAPKERYTASLAQRIVSIEGVDNGKGPIKRFIEELDAGELFDLVEALDESDGGVDTTCTIECPHCGNEEEVDLPLEDDFWAPPKRKRSTKPSGT